MHIGPVESRNYSIIPICLINNSAIKQLNWEYFEIRLRYCIIAFNFEFKNIFIMKIKISVIAVFLLISFVNSLNAQGCSDAGFCTLNAFKPDASSIEGSGKKTHIRAGLSYGQADQSVAVFSANIDIHRIISRSLSFDAKLTGINQHGGGIYNTGLSDIFINASYKGGENSAFTLGIKYPLHRSDSKFDGNPMPLYFQPSMGTIDILAGYTVNFGRLHLTLAYQHPVTHNKNEFLADQTLVSFFRDFQSTNQYIRRPDAMFRAALRLNIGKNLSLTPGALAIYHLANDRYTDSNGGKRDIEGSQGLTLNGNIFVDYRLSETSSVHLNGGMPFIVREARPDGLTRVFVCTFEYSFRF